MILKADRIITGDGSSVMEEKALYIRDGKINEIGEFHALRKKYPQSRVEEYVGATILPGLIDMHAHVGEYSDRRDAASYNDFMIAYFAEDYARKAFAKGVTTIRDVASPKNLCVSMN